MKNLRENIRPLEVDSEQLAKLNPVIFNYTFDTQKAEMLGLITEEVEQIFPSLVLYNNEGELLTVKYQELPIILLKEIQQLRIEIERLKKQI